MIKKQFITALLFTASSSVFAIDPLWLTSACYEMKFTAWDKFGSENYKVTYKVNSDIGTEYIAEFSASGHNSSTVVFPRDFIEVGRGKQAAVSCHGSTKYSWKIFVQDELKDMGSIVFSRGK